jgi:exopolysaccharide biosynthesis protein
LQQKKIWSEEVINSGIRNTFSFAGPVILNGRKLTTFSTCLPHNDNQSTAMLQLICQINENNYALFTSVKTNRQKAIDVFYSIGCQTAINLDGGGSTALLYKEKNSTKINTLFGGERQLTEAGYFTE